MKRKERHVSAAEYVLRIHEGVSVSSLARKLESFATVEPLSGHAGLYIVRLNKAGADPREGWEQLRRKLGEKVEVVPVFLDEHQMPLYPAGTILVRFPTPPTATELRKWLPQGLRVKSQNQYVPEQWSLEPDDPTNQYLPDLLAAAEDQSGKHVTIWPETIRHFRKA